MEIISGTALSKKIKAELSQQVEIYHSKYQRLPKLVLILVGDNPDSMTYVRSKGKSALAVGMECETIHLPETVTQDEVLSIISEFNSDNSVDAILVQLPLPAHIDKELILHSIDYHKDVDGLHPFNVGLLSDNNANVIPCTSKGILSLLQSQNIVIEGKHVVVVGRSNLVGKPTAQLMINENATVTLCHSKTNNLSSITKQADILIVAVGSPAFITPKMIKPSAVVIDVGINCVDGKLVGDVYNGNDLTELEGVVSYITPVPGGVGPMTIVSLLENTFELYKKRVLG